MPIRIAIVSDIRLYREGLTSLLTGSQNIQVICNSELEQTQTLLAQILDILLLDVACLRDVGMIGTLVGASPHVRIIALGMGERVKEIVDCLEAGASGYVSRQATKEDLVAMILEVSKGSVQFPPQITQGLVDRVHSLGRDVDVGKKRVRLTAREAEILDLLRLHLTNKDIALRLHIEVGTVKNHVHNILEKTHAHRRGEASVDALQTIHSPD